jgi:hypothetical protein
MKTLRPIFFGAVILFAASCQRESLNEKTTVSKKENVVILTDKPVAVAKKSGSGTCNPNAYTITLESHTLVNGNWEWIWSVQNPNPGNGNNGTSQDLSHWGMQVGSCVNLSSIVSGAYSSDGINWTNFTPSYQTDPSQSCMTIPVIKFDFGTTGGNKSYYRLVVNQDFTPGPVAGYYKSGVNTGCCTFSFTGIAGCGGPIEIIERLAK